MSEEARRQLKELQQLCVGKRENEIDEVKHNVANWLTKYRSEPEAEPEAEESPEEERDAPRRGRNRMRRGGRTRAQ